MANITRANWNYQTAAHLLNRAGFGHNGSMSRSTGEAIQIRALYASPSRQPEDFIDKLFPRRPARPLKKLDTSSRVVRRNWQKAMLKANGRRAVQEKMVLFLHGHLTSQLSVVGDARHMEKQLGLYRENAVGDFRDLVKRASINSAMLIYLNGDENRVDFINENFGRELLELFTMGPFDFAGNRTYSQTDVGEAARILSGWRDRSGSDENAEGFFTGSRHDTGNKTVFAPDPAATPDQNLANEFTVGDLGVAEYAELVDRVFAHTDTEGRPTVARFMVRKLWKFFAYDPEVDVGTARSDLALIDELADVFQNGAPGFPAWSLEVLLRAMFLREEFYSAQARTTTVLSPVDFVIGSVRKLGGGLPTAKNGNNGRSDDHRSEAMGQALFEPPNVAGWPGNIFWLSTQTNLERLKFAEDLASRDKRGAQALGLNIKKVLKWVPPSQTRADIVDRFLMMIGPVDVDTATRDTLIAWLGDDDSAVDVSSKDSSFVRARLRGLIYMILSLPQFQVG